MDNITLAGFNLYHLFYYFTIYSFLGWSLETVYVIYNEKHFVNKGFINGPFCPIYGFGTAILIVLLEPVKNNLIALFLGSILLTSALEYLTGFILEKLFHSTWWDYSDQPYNLQGRICVKFSIYWGLLSLIILKVLQPIIHKLVLIIPAPIGIPAAYLLFLYFAVDFTISVISIVGLNSRLKQLYTISNDIRSKLDYLKESTIEKAEVIEHRLHELRSRYELLLHKEDTSHSRLIKAFPRLKSIHFDSILKDIRDNMELEKFLKRK